MRQSQRASFPHANGSGDGDGNDRNLPRIAISEPVALRRAGREMALLVGSTVAADRSDPSLIRLVAKAWALREALVSSTAPSLTAVAAEQGMSQSMRRGWFALPGWRRTSSRPSSAAASPPA
jgi:hypothetical protein